MSQYAKSVVAAVAAVLIAGIDAWQSVTAGAPFRLVDLLPIATAVAGAVLTFLIPNVPELPWAKAAVSGVLAALTAVASFVTGHPADVTLLNLTVAALGALLTWYVPNLAPAAAAAIAVGKAAADAAAGHAQLSDVTDALSQLEQLDPAVAAEAAVTAPVVVPAPVGPVATEMPAVSADAAAGQRQIIAAGLAHLDALDAAALAAEAPAAATAVIPAQAAAAAPAPAAG